MDFLHECRVLARKAYTPTTKVRATPHIGTPEWKFFHWIHGQPAAIIECLSFFVSHLIEMLGLEVEHAAIHGDLLAARHDIERIKLEGFDLTKRRLDAVQPLETATRPKSLLTEQKTTKSKFGD